MTGWVSPKYALGSWTLRFCLVIPYIYIKKVNNKAMKTAAIKRLYNTDTNNRRIKRITKNAIINTAHIPAEVDRK